MIDVNKVIDLEIIKNYSEELLDIINANFSDLFIRNIFKFVILRYNYDENEFKISQFLRELKNLKKNEPELRNKKELYNLIDKYLGVSEVEKKGSGEVFTPFSLADKILDMFDASTWTNPYEKIFDGGSGIGNFQVVMIVRFMDGLKYYKDSKVDLTNESVRYKWIMENIIYTCDISEKNTFLYKNIFDPNNELKLNHYCGNFLSKEFDNYVKTEWNNVTFTKCVGNPPFTGMIDIKFLTKYYSFSDEISIVHPSTWILDEKNIQSVYLNIKELVKNDLKKITLFNGNGIFGISLFVPCSITYIIKNNNTKIEVFDNIRKIETTYNNINDINKYHTPEYLSLKDKLFTFSNTLLNNLKHTKKDTPQYKNIANLPQIIGDVKFRNKIGLPMDIEILHDNFYALFRKSQNIFSKVPNKHMFFEFDTFNEYENFEKYIKTKFVRFCLSTLKNNSQLDRGELKNIPWLDFTQEWTDEKLRIKYNISDKEWQFIDSVIPDYY